MTPKSAKTDERFVTFLAEDVVGAILVRIVEDFLFVRFLLFLVQLLF